MKVVEFSKGKYVDLGKYHYFETEEGIYPLNPMTANYFLLQENYEAVGNYLSILTELEWGVVPLSKLLED